MGHSLDFTLLLTVLCAAVAVQAQFGDFDAPPPPRLQIPGAVALGPAPSRRLPPAARLQARFRQAPPTASPLEDTPPSRFRQVTPSPSPFDDTPRARIRPVNGRSGRLPSPTAALPTPTPVPQFYSPQPVPQRPAPQPQEEVIPPRPVVEENEDDYDEEAPSVSFSPTPTATTPPPPPPPPPQRPSPSPAFRPERPVPVFRPERPALLPTPAPELNFVSPTRQQLRPTSFPDDERPRKPLYRVDQAYNSRNKVRPTVSDEEPQQFTRQPQQQVQQQFSRQPQNQQQYTRTSPQAVVRQPPKAVINGGKDAYEKPDREYTRKRKPVAQVLRRYRQENEDGSITWGYENDDGSFKEETIGTDCVTYGKYGYIDPDGNRREYTYSTGVLCNKEADTQSQGSEGYIDYAEMKYVLPNGDSIDLRGMGKKSRRAQPARAQERQYQR